MKGFLVSCAFLPSKWDEKDFVERFNKLNIRYDKDIREIIERFNCTYFKHIYEIEKDEPETERDC